MITVRLTTETIPSGAVRNVIQYYENDILSTVEVLADNKYEEVRNYQIAELFEYFKGELTTQQYVKELAKPKLLPTDYYYKDE